MRPDRGDRAGRRAMAATVIVAASLVVAPETIARDKPGIEVRDLYYGEVLFHFYQQDHFTALTNLLAARQAGRIAHHAGEAELLLGGLYLAYGQHTQAGEIFSRLLTSDIAPDVRDRAWFYLGKVRYQRGLHDQAIAAFERVTDALPGELQAERQMLLAQSWMNLGQFDAAARILESWQGPRHWSAYGRYNLGVALVRLDRIDAGAAMLDRVGRMDATTPELRSLRDKANLAMGYAFLQSGREAAARDILMRVRLHGPFSSKALLGVGWVHAANEDYRAALTAWLELRDRDLLDSAVQESLLAVPYAFGRLQAHGSAAEHYQHALAAFAAESQRLGSAIERATSGSLIPALLRSDDAGISRWHWQLDTLPDTPDARYLYHLVANHEFQDGLRNYRDLSVLDGRLEEWQQKLGTFRDMIETRNLAYAERLPSVQARLAEVDLEAAHARRDELAARLDAIGQRRDVVGLADARQREAWNTLVALESNPAFDNAGAATQRDKHRLLKGVLLWRLDRDYKHRMWQQQRALRQLDAALTQADELAGSAQAARIDEPQRLLSYGQRIEQLRPRIAQMRASVTAALERQQGHLQLLAVRELEAQQERLATYRVQARFALANIYDRATAAASD